MMPTPQHSRPPITNASTPELDANSSSTLNRSSEDKDSQLAVLDFVNASQTHALIGTYGPDEVIVGDPEPAEPLNEPSAPAHPAGSPLGFFTGAASASPVKQQDAGAATTASMSARRGSQS